METATLRVEFDGPANWATLRKKRPWRGDESAGFSIPPGLTLRDLHAALLATGWVTRPEEEAGLVYQIDADLPCERLAWFLGEMCQYFTAPGEPAAALSAVRQHIEEELAERESVDIPLDDWHLAWLDLTIRDALAEQARSVASVWGDDVVGLDLKRLRSTSIDALLARLQPTGTAPARLAPSRRSRGNTRSSRSA